MGLVLCAERVSRCIEGECYEGFRKKIIKL